VKVKLRKPVKAHRQQEYSKLCMDLLCDLALRFDLWGRSRRKWSRLALNDISAWNYISWQRGYPLRKKISHRIYGGWGSRPPDPPGQLRLCFTSAF